MGPPSGVGAYYEHNTRRFLRFGGAGSSGGQLHRSLRMPGVRTAADAADAIHHVVLAELRRAGVLTSTDAPDGRPRRPRPLIADLGCGVGATMEWLMEQADVETAGITLSRYQASLARTRLSGRATVTTGSFTSAADLRRMAGGRTLDAACMIESFVHADRIGELFESLGRIMRPNGVLIICDDLPTLRLLRQLEPRPTGNASLPRLVRLNRRLAADFRWGWHINAFHSVEHIAATGRRTGWRLEHSTDLTGYVDTSRPRDLAARLAAVPARLVRARTSWWRNVIGGSALQRLIRRRLVAYRVLVLRRDGPLSGS